LSSSWPWQDERAQAGEIYLRIDAGRIVVLVPQDLADLGQCRAGSQELGRKAVSEYMRSAASWVIDPSAFDGSARDIPYALRARESDMGRASAQEDMAAA